MAASPENAFAAGLFEDLPAKRSEERRVGKGCRWTGDWSSDVCSSDLASKCCHRQVLARSHQPADATREIRLRGFELAPARHPTKLAAGPYADAARWPPARRTHSRRVCSKTCLRRDRKSVV